MMNFKKCILGCILAVACVPFFTGCTDLFSDAPVDKISEKEVWRNPMLLDEYVLPWYRNMSNGFSTFVPTTIAVVKSASRYYMPWFGDQVVPSKTDYYNSGYGDILQSNNLEITNWSTLNWTKYYTQIQSVNRLLANSHEIPDGSQKNRILGEAYFFRAYYYYMLWRQFGGVMLIDRNFDPLKENVRFPRASYSEMVSFIVNDAQTAMRFLPASYEKTDEGRITRGAAQMLVAKTYFWASSNVFQNKQKSYLGFCSDSSMIMLDSARVSYERLMKVGYELVPIQGATQEEIKNEYRKIFLTKNSQESILEVQHSDDGNYSTGFGHKLDRDAASPFFTGTTCAYTPTHNHVKEYGMREGFVYQPKKPYEGRDYRFYANILYDGSVYKNHVMDIHYVRHLNEEAPGKDLIPYGTSSTAAVTRTGYYMGKFVDEQQQIDNNDTYASKQNYIIWRYAEAILDYAEVMFRLGDTETAREKVNDIRRRVHMFERPTLSWEELVNERRVEMAFEETTYWDYLRWGQAVEKFSGETNPLKAMKIVVMETPVKDTVYLESNLNRFPKRVRIFTEKQYYLPIPWDEVRFHKVPQNPDWEEN